MLSTAEPSGQGAAWHPQPIFSCFALKVFSFYYFLAQPLRSRLLFIPLRNHSARGALCAGLSHSPLLEHRDQSLRVTPRRDAWRRLATPCIHSAHFTTRTAPNCTKIHVSFIMHGAKWIQTTTFCSTEREGSAACPACLRDILAHFHLYISVDRGGYHELSCRPRQPRGECSHMFTHSMRVCPARLRSSTQHGPKLHSLTFLLSFYYDPKGPPSVMPGHREPSKSSLLPSAHPPRSLSLQKSSRLLYRATYVITDKNNIPLTSRDCSDCNKCGDDTRQLMNLRWTRRNGQTSSMWACAGRHYVSSLCQHTLTQRARRVHSHRQIVMPVMTLATSCFLYE